MGGTTTDARRTRVVVALLVLAGIALRLLRWRRWLNFQNGEASNVARALADGRGFADAFFVGQGPTAHLMPPTPLIAGAIWRVLGQGALGGWALIALSTGLSIGCYLFAARIVRSLGAPRGAMLAGFALVMLVPIHDSTEVARWQVWDGGLAALLLLTNVALLVDAERGRPAKGFAVWRTIVPAFALIVNPIVGIAATLCTLLFAWRRRGLDNPLRPIALLALTTAILFTPWVVRNERVLGRPIVLRDNLGLELGVAYFPEAVPFADPQEDLRRRQEAMHPLLSPAARAELVAVGGEAAYADKVGGEARGWMAAHPGAVVRIAARHLVEMLFPRPWMFRVEHESKLAGARSGLAALATIGALIELAIMLARGDPLAAYPLVALGVATALIVPFQPLLRYAWMLWPLSTMLAVRAAWRLGERRAT